MSTCFRFISHLNKRNSTKLKGSLVLACRLTEDAYVLYQWGLSLCGDARTAGAVRSTNNTHVQLIGARCALCARDVCAAPVCYAFHCNPFHCKQLFYCFELSSSPLSLITHKAEGLAHHLDSPLITNLRNPQPKN